MEAVKIAELNRRTSETIVALTSLWRASVAATHSFLSQEEIDAMLPEVRAGLNTVEKLAVALDGDGKFAAFMGVENGRLEMLFVAPRAIGKGVGRKLVEYGIEKYGVDELTVNKQNPSAVGFYEHLGFTPYKETATDEQGRPYPLVYMKRRKSGFTS